MDASEESVRPLCAALWKRVLAEAKHDWAADDPHAAYSYLAFHRDMDEAARRRARPQI